MLSKVHDEVINKTNSKNNNIYNPSKIKYYYNQKHDGKS